MDAATEADHDRRWAEAGALLNGAQDKSAQEAFRRRRRKMLLIGSGVWLLMVVVAGVIGWFAAERNSPAPDVADPSHPLRWVQICGLICLVVGFLILVFSLVRLSRSGRWGRGPAPASALTRSQQRELYRQMSGKTPVQPERLALVRDSARRTVQMRRQLWTMVGSGIMLFGVVLDNGGRFSLALTVALIVL